MTDPLTAEAIYLRVGSLIADAPDLKADPTPETHRWVAQVLALIEAGELVNSASIATFKVASQNMEGPLRDLNAGTILSIAHQALAKAELHAPAELQGAFIAAGHAFDAFAAVGKALGTATGDVFIVDPYAEAKLLTDYAVLAPETVSLRVLTEATYSKALKPAAEHWRQQMKQALEVRLGAPRTLHDRLILIDGKTAFVLGQSFKDLATRAHTSLVRMPPDAGKLKIEAYELMWSSATLL
ncbi:hypothetical protein SAMN05443248_0250 [Bradyrhizobium erythrophlei]|uniref:Uncharacterized protein n=1 Tax=Bradyrhizobium erythrophlei TaxID=1437360 RepID=A0A1M5GZG0_9BRAD|nr:hypothetical protein SAMN05443248_0250 [Bradyrhizobium erythrophlei]